MHLRSILGVILPLVAVASARISGISVPRTIKAGDSINVRIGLAPGEPSDFEKFVNFGIAPASVAIAAVPGTSWTTKPRWAMNLHQGTCVHIHRIRVWCLTKFIIFLQIYRGVAEKNWLR